MTGMSVVSLYYLVASAGGQLNGHEWFTSVFSDSQNGVRNLALHIEKKSDTIKKSASSSYVTFQSRTSQIGVRTQIWMIMNDNAQLLNLSWRMWMLTMRLKDSHKQTEEIEWPVGLFDLLGPDYKELH